MRVSGRLRCVIAATFALGFVLVFTRASVADEAMPLTEHQKIVHVMNRLGYGPRPGDVERVEKMGLAAYIQQQLDPDAIDDSAADKAIERFDTLRMSSAHLMDEYYGDIRRFIDQQRMTGDPKEMKLRYGVNITRDKSAPQARRPSRRLTSMSWSNATPCAASAKFRMPR